MKRKIGLMGGTFNPIHLGHIQIAEHALAQMDLDEVWFLPTGNSYHKKTEAIPAADRAAMVELAIRSYPHFRINDLEMRREGATYTADTLRELTECYPDVRFYYLVGADSLDYKDRWVRPEEIFSRAVILVMGRNSQSRQQTLDKAASLKARFHADVRLLDGHVLSVSSSEIREKVRTGASLAGLLPADVISYTEEKGLYRNGRND